MELSGINVMVVGLARTGQEVAAFLARKGARVSATDIKGPLEISGDLTGLERLGVELHLGRHPVELFRRTDLVVVSPGVPLETPAVQAAVGEGVEVISEIELGYRFLKVPVVAVTGSNGKSTTVSLIGEMFNLAGVKAFVGGNLGTPLILAVGDESVSWAVAEVSSFQLEAIKDFRPRISVFLNLSPDHLDRHGTYEAYCRAKARVFLNQGDGDFAVLNLDDPEVIRNWPPGKGRAVHFSQRDGRGAALYGAGGSIVSHLAGTRKVFQVSAPGLIGVHNLENAMAAVAVAQLVGLEEEAVRGALREFRGLPHRTELVGTIGGVRYYNDSKATNVASVKKALQSFPGGIVLIAGGRDKGADFRELGPEVSQRVKAMVLIGEAREKMAAALSPFTTMRMAEDMREAVSIANQLSLPGDVVLLSPACASFDMFSNYEERGETFRRAVADLERESDGR